MDDLIDMSPKEEAILIMEGLGFFLIELKGKIPKSKKWQTITQSEIPSDFSENYGVVLNSSSLVIDVDPKNGGIGSFKKLLGDLGLEKAEDFNTLIVKTGNNGLHIYLEKPDTIDVRWTLKEYPGVEFRTKGQQMVGPLSTHPQTKKPYTFRNDIRTLAPIPEKLLQLIRKDTELVVKEEAAISDDLATVSRFIKYLQDEAPAVEGAGGDKFTFIVACRGKDMGLPLKMTTELMLEWWNAKCNPPWSLRELKSKVRNAYEYGIKQIGSDNAASQFVPLDGEDPEANEESIKIRWDIKSNNTMSLTLNNAANFFKLPKYGLMGLLRFNILSREIEFVRPASWHIGKGAVKRAWTDTDAINLKYYLSSTCKFDVPVTLIHEAASVAAFSLRYNPLIDYLDTLQWDGIPRISKWLSTYAGAEDNAYTQTVGRKILIAAVARAYQPGIQFDHVMVLEGGQGIGKSTLCRILGSKWYADVNIDPTNKDAIGLINGKWIIELSEMTVTRKSEADALKAFISRCEDRARPAYARTTEDFPRACIFIGTVNPEENTGYLKDQTGNRRFWPITITHLKRDKLTKDLDQLWAEAKAAYEAQEEIYIIDEETNQMALDEAHQRKVKDPWVYTVTNYLENVKDINGEIPSTIFIEDIWTDVLGGSMQHFKMSDKARLGSIMKDLGYKGHTAHNKNLGGSRYGYSKEVIRKHIDINLDGL